MCEITVDTVPFRLVFVEQQRLDRTVGIEADHLKCADLSPPDGGCEESGLTLLANAFETPRVAGKTAHSINLYFSI